MTCSLPLRGIIVWGVVWRGENGFREYWICISLCQISCYEWLLDDDTGPSHWPVVIPHPLGGPGKGRWSRHWLRMSWKVWRRIEEWEHGSPHQRVHWWWSVDWSSKMSQEWDESVYKGCWRMGDVMWKWSKCDCRHVIGLNLCWRIFECWWDESFLIHFKCILPCSELILLNYHKWLRSFWMIYE